MLLGVATAHARCESVAALAMAQHTNACRDSEDVLWRPSSDGHPSVPWLQTLWDHISGDPGGAAAVGGWPLLPVFGGKLVRVGAAVLEEGSWSAGVASALAKLGCRVLDTSTITLDVAKVRPVGRARAVCSRASLQAVHMPCCTCLRQKAGGDAVPTRGI